MTLPGSSVCLTRQLGDSPPVIQSYLPGRWVRCTGISEWVASTFILPSSPMQEQQHPDGLSQHSSHSFPHNDCLDLDFPDTSLYPTPVDQVNLDPVYAEDQSLVFLESNSSFDSNISDSGFTSLNSTQDDASWTTSGSQYGLDVLFAEDPVSTCIFVPVPAQR